MPEFGRTKSSPKFTATAFLALVGQQAGQQVDLDLLALAGLLALVERARMP